MAIIQVGYCAGSHFVNFMVDLVGKNSISFVRGFITNYKDLTMNIRLSIAIASLALVFAPSLFARNILTSWYGVHVLGFDECGRMVVHVANKTDSICTLEDAKLTHGNFEKFPALSIRPGDTTTFELVQSFMGPDITLTYDCGGKKVAFQSQQNVCVLKGGMRHPMVVREDSGITVKDMSWDPSWIDADGASFIFMRPGQIRWSIENR